MGRSEIRQSTGRSRRTSSDSATTVADRPRSIGSTVIGDTDSVSPSNDDASVSFVVERPTNGRQ
jgi:hypothetical protein